MSDVIIIGGGLAGIAAGRALGARAHLLEAQDQLGGLARTDVVDGFWFDWTGHWLHLRTEKWKTEVERLLPGGLLTIERQARIYSNGVFTPFPFQVNTFGLPPEVIANCLKGFIAANLGPEGAELRGRELKTFHDFVLRYLGEGINRHFMEPYNRKLYTVDPVELSAEWGGRFVPRPTLDEVIDGAVGRVRKGIGYNATFVYPAQGGIEAVAKAIASELTCSMSLNARVERIDTQKRELHLFDGQVLPYKHLLSTMPLKQLVQRLDPCPPEVQAAAEKLRSISVSCVEIGVQGAPPVPFHWAYFAEPQFPFYRVGSPSQVNAALAPAGHTSYAVEFSHQGPPPDEKTSIEQAIDGLERAGILKRSDVVLSRMRTIRVAYVLVDHACTEARRTILQHVNSCGIEVAGRYGNWEYSGMEDALVSGDAAAQRILAKEAAESASRLAS
jgi:protoporphyrinogen oxidase